MNLLDGIYQKTVEENEKNLHFWEGYVNNLKSLDFGVYADKLKVPSLVPVGSRIFFRGELKHTNEVTVALGADYFVKCSLTQAEILRQHRIKDAESKLDLYRKEKEYLENKITFNKQNVFEKEGQEIIEEHTEGEDKAWREIHKENVRKYKQRQAKEEKKPQYETTDEELWARLEELELQEELENEMLDNYNEIEDMRKANNFLANEEKLLLNSFKDEKINYNKIEKFVEQGSDKITDEKQPKKNNNYKVEPTKITANDRQVKITEAHKPHKESSKHDLLQKVLEKQNELEHKLHELKYKEKQPSKTEADLLSRLDEMEQLDELEDDMERLEDILEAEDVVSDDSKSENDSIKSDSKLKKGIYFEDQDDSETLELTFKHSDIEPNNDPYVPEKGITKPSDVYKAFSHLFDGKKASILTKKSKYDIDDSDTVSEKQIKQVKFGKTVEMTEPEEESRIEKTIFIKDVKEKSTEDQMKIETGARPTSLFKKRRMQNSK